MSILLKIKNCHWIDSEKFFSNLPHTLRDKLNLEVNPKSKIIIDNNSLFLEKKDSNSEGVNKKIFNLNFDKLSKQLFLRIKTSTNNDLLKKALGKNIIKSQVFDLSAGFGFDSILMNYWGYPVSMIERNPEIFLINSLFLDYIKYILNHSRLNYDELKIRKHLNFDNIRLFFGDSLDFIKKNFVENKFDPNIKIILYYDPMFEKKKTKAAPPLRAQILREYCGKDPDSSRIVDYILSREWKSSLRLVYKKPLKNFKSLVEASVQYKGKLVKYDVYIR